MSHIRRGHPCCQRKFRAVWLSVATKLKVTQSPLWEEKRGKPTEVHTAIHIDLKSSVLEEEGKRECPCDPSILLLGVCPNKIKPVYQRDICTPKFFVAVSQKSTYGNNEGSIDRYG